MCVKHRQTTELNLNGMECYAAREGYPPPERPRTGEGEKVLCQCGQTTLGAAEIETKFTIISLGIRKQICLDWKHCFNTPFVVDGDTEIQ